MEYLENVLGFLLKQDLVYSTQLFAKEWLFSGVFNKKSKLFVFEENSGLHKRELLKYHESFPLLGESVNRNSIIMISKGYHYVNNFGIVSNFYIRIDPVYLGSSAKVSIVAGKIRGIWVLFSP